MKSSLTLAFVFSFSILFAQTSERHLRKVDMYSYKVDSCHTQLDTLKFTFDSIKVTTNIYKEKYFTVSHFENSNTNLTIVYYFKAKELILVRVSERSPKFNDLYHYYSFYISDNKIVSKKNRFSLRQYMAVALDNDIYEVYGYNKTFNNDFLKQYIFTLRDKIKLQLTKDITNGGF
jgi:hypothetical protein